MVYRKFNLSKDELYELYVIKKLTQDEIAKIANVSRRTVGLWLDRYGIKKRPRNGVILKVNSLKLPKEEWKYIYLAGIIDGEGTIKVRQDKQHRHHLVLQVGNTCFELIKWLQDNFGGYIYERIPKKRTWSKYWVWELHGVLDVSILLSKIIPYLIVKKQKAEDLINLAEEIKKRYIFE